MAKKQGSIFILFMWVLVLASMFALSVGFRTRLSTKIEGYEMKRFEQNYDFLTAVNVARFLIESDDETDVDYRLDEWYGQPAELDRLPYGESFELEIYDEESKINVNKASENLLIELFEVMKRNGVSLKTDPKKLAGSFLAWRGQSVRQGGMTTGHKQKMAPFESLEEMYLLQYITPEDIEAIRPYLTIYGEERGVMHININTAHSYVIEALISHLSGDASSKKKILERIINVRETTERSDEGDQVVLFFRKEDLSLSNFLTKLELSPQDPRLIRLGRQLIQFLTVDSRFFSVHIRSKRPKMDWKGVDVILGERVMTKVRSGPSIRSIARTGDVVSVPLEILSWQERIVSHAI